MSKKHIINLYSSNTPGNAPLPADLISGELAINIADGKLFYKDNGGLIKYFLGITQTDSRYLRKDVASEIVQYPFSMRNTTTEGTGTIQTMLTLWRENTGSSGLLNTGSMLLFNTGHSGTEYLTGIASINTKSSPSTLDPEMSIRIQKFGMTGIANLAEVARFTSHDMTFNATTNYITDKTLLGNLHIIPYNMSNDGISGISFAASGNGTVTTDNQAGIYVKGSGAYGTHMLFGTTASFASGSKINMVLTCNGALYLGALAGSINSGTAGAIVATSTITGSRLISNVTQGTAPIAVTSSTRVDQLNVQYLNGQDGAYYLNYANLTSKPKVFREVLILSSGVTAGTAITIPNSMTYTVNGQDGNSLKVFRDGIFQIRGTSMTDCEYYEVTGGATVIFKYDLPTDTEITFMI